MTRRLVAIDLAPGPNFVNALQRVWDDGDAALPVDQRLPAEARATLFTALAPAVILTDEGETACHNSVPMLYGDALVVPTSGTTGIPKGVVLTHAAVRASAEATSARIGIDPHRHRWLSCLPLAHIGGLSVVTRALHTNTPLIVFESFDAGAVDAAPAMGATHTSLVVSALQRVDPTRWECIVVGGSAMPADLPVNTLRTYGMTETGSGVVYNGRPLAGVEVRVVNDRLELRGPMLFRAYRQRSANSANGANGANGNNGALTPEGHNPLHVDGWFATGDGGALLPDGTVVVFGRVGEVIVTGGEKVWPDAVEKVLRLASGVGEVAVAGRPDATWGAKVVAWVVPIDPTNAPTLELLRAHMKQFLPAYAAPHEIRLCRSLPRTATGKIQRAMLPD